MDESKLLSPKFGMLMLLVRHKIVVSAIAAGIILIVGLFVFRPETQVNVEPQEVVKVTTQTPAELMSLMSINLAYNRGGLDEVEKQYEKAITEIGPRPAQITIAELLAESNGT